MGLKEQYNYLSHILRLVRNSPTDLRFWKFSLIGVSGLGVNLFIYTGLIRFLHLEPLWAGAVAAAVAILSNFLFNRSFTWGDSDPGKSFKHFALFYLFSGVGVLINLTGLYLLTRFGRVHFLVAQIVAIGVATFWNFSANSRFNWREKPTQTTKEIITPNEESLA